MADELIPDRLKALMDENNEQQADLAAAVDVSRSYITKLVNGKKPAGRALLGRLADHYGVSVDYLVGRSAVRKPSAGDETLKEANERALLAAFHALPVEDHALAVRLLRGMRASPDTGSRPPKRKRHNPAA